MFYGVLLEEFYRTARGVSVGLRRAVRPVLGISEVYRVYPEDGGPRKVRVYGAQRHSGYKVYKVYKSYRDSGLYGLCCFRVSHYAIGKASRQHREQACWFGDAEGKNAAKRGGHPVSNRPTPRM